MAKRVLVPLDGSPAAEEVLSLVADAARTSGASVCVLHVARVPGTVHTPEGRIVAFADQEMERVEAEQMDYRLALAAGHLTGVAVECRVRFGDPVEEILEEIQRSEADLVAVATKTRSSITRALLGSVAEELLRKAPVAVMLVRAVS